jgi:hypothetical protein
MFKNQLLSNLEDFQDQILEKNHKVSFCLGNFYPYCSGRNDC